MPKQVLFKGLYLKFLILVTVLGAGLSIWYWQSMLKHIEYTPPFDVPEQDQQIIQMNQGLTILIELIKQQNQHPSDRAITEVLNQANALQNHSKILRKTYRLDTLTEAPGIHSTIIPSLIDIQKWLTEGAYGFAPDSPEVLQLVESRASNMQDHLNQQRHLFTSFRRAIIVTSIILVLLAGLLINFILQQQKSNRQLRYNESRFRDFAQVASDWYWQIDENLRFTYVSERFEEVLGLKPETVIGKSREEAFEGNIDNSAKWARGRKLLESHQPYSMEFDMSAGDGGVKTLRTQAIPFYDEQGKFLGYRGIGTDITAEKQARDELKYSEQRFKDFADIATDYLWELDSDLRFTYVSERYEQVTGLTRSQLIGKTRKEFWAANNQDVEKWQDHLNSLEAHEPIEPYLYTWVRPDGSNRHLVISGKQLVDQNNNFIGYRGIATDVSETTIARKEAEEAREAAENANRAKSDFLANISHEIRTPMTLIIGMLDLLEETKLSPQQQQHLSTIKKSGDSLLRLINRILDISKIESGYLHLADEPFDMTELLNKLKQAFQPHTDASGIKLNMTIKDDVEVSHIGDQYRLEQVLGNLLDNAIKFTDRGEISVSVQNDPNNNKALLFSVEDSGCGFPPELSSRIFDAFEQQDSSDTREYGGAGLGLTICKQIVSAMGGEIWAQSEVGKGSAFRFAIPFKPHQSATGKPSVKPGKKQSQQPLLKVLVVEDELLVRTLIVEFFKSTNHNIITARNGVEAIELIQSADIDLVFMDLRMPIMDGYTAIQRIRSWEQEHNKKPLAIIALSASVMAADIEKCLSAGFTAHLAKPMQKAKLLQMVETYRPKAKP